MSDRRPDLDWLKQADAHDGPFQVFRTDEDGDVRQFIVTVEEVNIT